MLFLMLLVLLGLLVVAMAGIALGEAVSKWFDKYEEGK